ncbi:hypothetical protein PG997_007320 [Apiospora hydei]|uniref:Uncharacterized protein n=1 Tax=Apiospora hydei TaxID=1337664 RepID=A0ABR1W7P3_9PEZI
MSSFQFKPNARPFVPFRTLSEMALGLSAKHASEGAATPSVNSSSNTSIYDDEWGFSSNKVECQAIFQYHTCQCRTRTPVWVCPKNQSNCSHPNPSILVSGLPHACRVDTKVGGRALILQQKQQQEQQQSRSKKGKKNNIQNQQTGPRTEACTAQDPANVGWRGDTDAALHTQVLTLENFPGLTAEDFDEIVPVFVADGKSWREEVWERHEQRRVAAYASSEESSEPGRNSDSSSSEDEDEDCATGTASAGDDAMEKFNRLLYGAVGSKTPAAAAVSVVPECESEVDDDGDAEYDCDDEDEEEAAEERRPSLRSLVEDSVADDKDKKKSKN